MKRLYILFFSIVLSTPVLAQFNLGLHQFTGVPQSVFTNPGIMPQARFFIGLPGAYVNYYNPTFVLDDIIREVGDSSMLDFTKLYTERAGKTFTFNIEEHLDLLHVGFHVGRKNFFSFGAYQVFQSSFSLPVDLTRLAQNGSLDPYFRDNPISLNDMGIDANTYAAYHVGYTREITPKLTIGGRFKYLNGLAGGEVEYSEGSIYWQTDSLVVNNRFRYNTSNINSLAGGGEVEIGNFLPFSDNKGTAFDLGASYKITKRLMVSASVTDLGGITWKSDLKSYVTDSGGYTYRGGNITVGENDNGDAFGAIGDSLAKAFNVQTIEGKEFTTRLNTRYILSASYEWTKGQQFGVIFSNNRYNSESFPAFTGFYQSNFWNLLYLRANYTVSPGSFDNLGGALSLKLGPVQVYTVADNLLALANQGNVSTFNVRFGLNLVFGMRGYKDKDKEILEFED